MALTWHGGTLTSRLALSLSLSLPCSLSGRYIASPPVYLDELGSKVMGKSNITKDQSGNDGRAERDGVTHGCLNQVCM